MRDEKQTAVPAKKSNVSDDKGERYVHDGAREKSKRNAVEHEPDADEEPGRKTTAARRGRVKRRARYARLTTEGRAASMDDVQPGSTIKHPVEQPDSLTREKPTLDNDKRRSEERGRRHREKSRRSKSPGNRAMPGLRPSYREAALEEPKAVAKPLTHKLLARQLQDQEGQTTETELLSSATEKDKYSEQVVPHKAAMEVESPAATKVPRSAAALLSDEGGYSISAGGARKCGQSTETMGFNRTGMNRAILVAILWRCVQGRHGAPCVAHRDAQVGWRRLHGFYLAQVYPLDNDTIKPVEANYGSDFVVNAFQFTAGGGSPGTPLQDLDALLAECRDREVAQRLLIQDFYYAHTARVVLNYATFGYYLAKQPFWAGSPWHGASNDSHGNSSAAWDLKEHTRCLASYAKHSSGIEMYGAEPRWLDAVGVHWAAEVSFRVAAFRDAKITQERSLK